MKKYLKQKAFTLIELLVVIFIIAILATIILAATNISRAKARDAQRIGKVQNILAAEQLYYDRVGNFPGWASCPGDPVMSYVAYSNCTGGGWSMATDDVAYLLTSGGYLDTMPLDPINKGGPGQSSNYTLMVETWPYDPGATTYVCANLESSVPKGSVSLDGWNYCQKAGDLTAH